MDEDARAARAALAGARDGALDERLRSTWPRALYDARAAGLA
jgi:hypothetical protein